MQLTPGAWAVQPIQRARPSPATPNRCDPAGPMDAHTGRRCCSGKLLLPRAHSSPAAFEQPRPTESDGCSRVLECGTSTTTSLFSFPPPSPSTTSTSLSTVAAIVGMVVAFVQPPMRSKHSMPVEALICVPLRKQKRWVQSEKVRQFIHIYCVTSEPESKSHKCSSFTLQVCHTFDIGGFCAILLKKNDLWGTLLVVDTKCAFKYLQSIISSIFVLKCYAYPLWPQKYAWLTGRSSLRVVILFFRVQIIVFFGPLEPDGSSL
uniref:Uncharacterized protein n=1 Tax=Triticum urartu TaxID=4572 RepID=A0A8R7PT34_TRIUA